MIDGAEAASLRSVPRELERKRGARLIDPRLILVSAGITVGLACGEAAGRALHYLPARPLPEYVRLRSAVGPLPDPWSRAWNTSAADEFRTQLVFNALGFRNARTDFSPTPGRRHVLVLGDSYAAAWQMPTEQRWSDQLDALRPDWETLDLGVPNWGTDQEYLLLEHYPFRAKPDTILLSVFLGNDVSDNGRLALTGTAPPRPYFTLNPADDGASLTEVTWPYADPFDRPAGLPFPASLREWLHLHSVVYRLAGDVRHRLDASGETPPRRAPTGLPLEFNVFGIQPSQNWEIAWKITQALVLRIAETARAWGSRVGVVLVPYYAAVQPELTPAPLADRSRFDVDAPFRRFATFAEAHGIPVLDLTPGFMHCRQADPDCGELFFSVDKHFTRAGNCLAAVLIANGFDSGPPADRARCR